MPTFIDWMPLKRRHTLGQIDSLFFDDPQSILCLRASTVNKQIYCLYWLMWSNEDRFDNNTAPTHYILFFVWDTKISVDTKSMAPIWEDKKNWKEFLSFLLLASTSIKQEILLLCLFAFYYFINQINVKR